MPSSPTRAPLLLTLVLPTLLAQSQAQAQGPQTPAQAEPSRRIQPTRPTAAPPARPAQPTPAAELIPGLENAELTLPDTPLLAEGTFLVRQRGSLTRAPSGEWIALFNPDAQGRRPRPMVLLPSQTLDRMAALHGERGPAAGFWITGQVFAYGELNYLLPTAYAVATDPAAAPAPSQPTAAQHAAPTEGALLQATPEPDSAAAIIRALESQRERPRGLERAPTAPPSGAARPNQSAPPAAAAELIPEGTQLLRRRGRMVRDSDGRQVFVFDSGPANATSADPPLPMLPCRTLELMEAWTARLGESITFTVSGTVYVHSGRNFLLPTIFSVNRPGDLAPRQ